MGDREGSVCMFSVISGIDRLTVCYQGSPQRKMPFTVIIVEMALI